MSTRQTTETVKIRHNGTYETQYLHMSKRLVKVGDVVKQGQVIGKVGSTVSLGLTSVSGSEEWEQVDHRKHSYSN